MTDPLRQHTANDHHRDDATSVAVAILTVSDTRTLDNDRSGDTAVSILTDAGHQVRWRGIEKDDPVRLRSVLLELTGRREIDAIVLTGGTGLSPRDQTPAVVVDLLDVELPGFGEYFRAVSIEEIGPLGMLSRALAGRRGHCVLFAIPGSTAAVTTALHRCILPVLRHAVGLASDAPTIMEGPRRTRSEDRTYPSQPPAS